MKLEKAFSFIFAVFILLTVSGCTGTPILPISGETPKPTRQWKIIPTQISVSALKDGWQGVLVDIALENLSGQFASPAITTTNTVISTQEGYTYPATAWSITWSAAQTQQIEFGDLLPPGFRIRGEYHNDVINHQTFYQFTAKIAQNTHATKLTLPGYGDIDLNNVSSVTFPGGDSYAKIRKPGDMLEIPGKARLTVLSFTKETLPMESDRPERDRITAPLRFENLNKGYDTTLNITFTILGDDGFIGFARYYPMGSMECSPELKAGPAQTIETKVCLFVQSGTKNLRLILTGDLNEVYDTGF